MPTRPINPGRLNLETEPAPGIRTNYDMFYAINDYSSPVTTTRMGLLYNLLLRLYLLHVFTAHTSDSGLIVRGTLVGTKTQHPKDSILQVISDF